MTERFSREVLRILEAGGWFDGRWVAISPPEHCRPFARAQTVLAEFGGLHLGACGTGVSWATSDIEIASIFFADRDTDELERTHHNRFFVLGQIHRGHAYLVIDDQGRIYLINGELMRLAPTFDRAVELLLLGKKASRGEIESAWPEGTSIGAFCREGDI